MKRRKILLTLLSTVAMMFLLLLTTTQAQTAATSFSGNATGVIATANILGGTGTVNAQVARTADLPSFGGREIADLGSATVDLDGGPLALANLTTGIINTRTSGGPAGVAAGDTGATNNSSQSQAVVNTLNLNIAALTGFAGLTVSATTVTANSTCVCGPNCTGTSVIENLRVGGLLVSNSGAVGTIPFTTIAGTVTVNANGTITADPNSQIRVVVGGVTVDLFINEQTRTGTTNNNITVNALRIAVNVPGVVTTNIIVAQAYSDITCVTGPLNTGNITVDKAFCDSIGSQNVCNGKPASFPSSVNFTVSPVGFGNETNILVPIAGNAKGDNTVTGFPVGRYLVCEVVPSGFVSTPRPENSSGGGSQSLFGTNCILAEIVAGNNNLKFLNSPTGPTAATATVSGRIRDVNGKSASRVNVTLTNLSTGESLTTRTNSLGRYTFEDVPTGGSYSLKVSSKRYVFSVNERVINLLEDLTDANFTAMSPDWMN